MPQKYNKNCIYANFFVPLPPIFLIICHFGRATACGIGIERQKTKNNLYDMSKKKNQQEEKIESEETMSAALEEKIAGMEEQIAGLEREKADLEDKNLRMMAEFDNYRRRTNKEKLDLMETAGEKIFIEMLPLIDDFERAIAAIDDEGVKLIYQKFLSFLDKHGVHAIETDNVDFNTDEHEAITTFAAGEEKKGKVIDCTQKGYKLGDKVIRFAKVVVGE